jgi:HAD superfamily hydrolase (TIGR01484 family)
LNLAQPHETQPYETQSYENVHLGRGIGRVGYRVVAFDLDDTLTVSKSPIETRMAELLAQLLRRVEICIISGGRFEQFETQVLRLLPIDVGQRRRLHVMPTCGTRYYRWSGEDWHQVYAEDFTDEDKRRIIDVLTAGAKQLGLGQDRTWGDINEDRGSLITFSALGQSAPPREMYQWVPVGSRRRDLCRLAVSRLPELEVRSGGSTSVDVTKKGVDKAYGMRKLMHELELAPRDVLFIGDRLDEGGNDYPVKLMGLDCVAVSRWEDTADYVERLLTPNAS